MFLPVWISLGHLRHDDYNSGDDAIKMYREIALKLDPFKEKVIKEAFEKQLV